MTSAQKKSLPSAHFQNTVANRAHFNAKPRNQSGVRRIVWTFLLVQFCSEPYIPSLKPHNEFKSCCWDSVCVASHDVEKRKRCLPQPNPTSNQKIPMSPRLYGHAYLNMLPLCTPRRGTPHPPTAHKPPPCFCVFILMKQNSCHFILMRIH